MEKKYTDLVIKQPTSGQKVIENKFFRLCVPKESTAVINDEGGTIKLADSVVEFAVAEMPVSADQEEDYLKIYKLSCLSTCRMRMQRLSLRTPV